MPTVHQPPAATTVLVELEARCAALIRARDAGALAYLVKPFQKADLFPAIEVALGRFQELVVCHKGGLAMCQHRVH